MQRACATSRPGSLFNYVEVSCRPAGPRAPVAVARKPSPGGVQVVPLQLTSASPSSSMRLPVFSTKALHSITSAFASKPEPAANPAQPQPQRQPQIKDKQPLQLPAAIYTRSDNGETRWNAILEYADDKYGSSYKVRAEDHKTRCAYMIRIVGVYDEVRKQPLPVKDLPERLRYLVGWTIASLTKANGLIKGKGVKHTESGWEAWHISANNKAIKEQKNRYNKKTGELREAGGGFINRATRTPDMKTHYCRLHSLPLDTPDKDLPPLTDDEQRNYFWARCDEHGTLKPLQSFRELPGTASAKSLARAAASAAVDSKPAPVTSASAAVVAVLAPPLTAVDEQLGQRHATMATAVGPRGTPLQLRAPGEPDGWRPCFLPLEPLPGSVFATASAPAIPQENSDYSLEGQPMHWDADAEEEEQQQQDHGSGELTFDMCTQDDDDDPFQYSLPDSDMLLS